jgi:hypothetical protein
METFVGDTTKIILKTGIDLTGYADIRMRFRRPDGTAGEWIPTVHGTEDTWMEYTTVTADLNMAGEWTIQAFAADTGILLRGKWCNFTVYVPIKMTYTQAMSGQSAAPAGGVST